MGTWGYGSLDSDTGGDYVNDELNTITKRIWKTLNRRGRDWQEKRAACALVRSMREAYLLEPPNTTEPYIRLANKCIDTLEAALADERWICDWDDPAPVVREIKKEITFFKKILKDPKFRN